MQEFNGKTICVTGGAGYIGSHMVNNLLAIKAKVVIIDNLSNSVKPKNKAETAYNTVRLSSVGLEWIDDITTPEVSEGDLKMRDYLCDIYLYDTNTQTGEKILKDIDRTIGNKKSVGLYISILRQHLGLTLYEFYYFCSQN